MRKFTLFIASLFIAIGAMAQGGFFAGAEVTFTNIQKDGTTKYTLYINENNELALTTTSADELGGAAKFFCEKRANNKYSFYNREKELYLIWRGKGEGYNSDKGVLGEYNATYCDWTISKGETIASTQTYFFAGKRSNGSSDGSLVVMKAGTFDGWGNSQAYSDSYTNLYDIEVVNREFVADASAFENGKIYTFVTERGWMGAKEGNNNVISTAKTSHNLTGSEEDTNFQWAVYKSENGNYYLYNIGAGKFMGVQASNNASIPFAVSPVGKNLTFKVSSNIEYPIMFSTNNAAVVNHSTSYGDGCISWTGGWGTLNDPGSNHKVEIVGNVSDEIIAKIEKLVAVREIGYFRLKGNSGNYIDASATWNNTNQMSMKSDENCNLAGTIFYYDDNNRFLNYATGKYINETRALAAVNATGNTWSVYISETEDKFKLYSSANSWLHDNAGTRADRCSSEGDHANTTHSWTIEKVEALPVTISEAKYSTFFAPVAVEIPDGVTAYTATANVGGWADMNEIENGVIPANTGVILYSETAKTYSFTITENVDAIANNELLGSAAATYVTPNGTAYVLSAPEGKVGLYKAALNVNTNTTNDDPEVTFEAFQNNANKAYLVVPTEEAAGIVFYSFNFDWTGTTGIEGVTAEGAQDGAIYDITGRRVKAITAPGIYIVNGKKMVK